MALKTRKPNGLPSWPIVLLTGPEKVGKSWAIAAASGSDLIDRTFWISVGEQDPEEYGAVPGARFEIVEHDGTYRGILNAIVDAADEAVKNPAAKGRVHCLAGDSWTKVWALLSSMAQREANARRDRKNGGRKSDDEADISMDLWNIATSRWEHILEALRSFPGPVILTARMEEVTLVEDGKPVKDPKTGKIMRIEKVQAQKGLPNDVGAIVKMRNLGEAELTGVRSVALSSIGGWKQYERYAFTLDALWSDLGLDGKTTARTHSTTDDQGEEKVVRNRQAIIARVATAAQQAGVALSQVEKVWADEHNGEVIHETFELGDLMTLEKRLLSRVEKKETTVPAAEQAQGAPAEPTAPESAPTGPQAAEQAQEAQR